MKCIGVVRDFGSTRGTTTIIIKNDGEEARINSYEELQKICNKLNIPCIPDLDENVKSISINTEFFYPSYVQFIDKESPYTNTGTKIPFSKYNQPLKPYLTLINNIKYIIKETNKMTDDFYLFPEKPKCTIL